MWQNSKNILLTLLFLTTTGMVVADGTVVHQLGGVNRQGDAVVIENRTGSDSWDVVFNGHLSNCVMNEFVAGGLAHQHSLSTFHQQLDGQDFAFGCSNGFVFLMKSGRDEVKISSPSENIGSAWNILGSYNSPIFLVYSQAFNQQYNKKWLFAAQHGYLFIIDIKTEKLVNVTGWPGGTYLKMGDGRPGTDYTKPVQGLDMYQDNEGRFYLIGTMERRLSKKQSRYSRALLQRMALPDGEPDSQWVDVEDEAIDDEGHGFLQYADTGFTKNVTAATETDTYVPESKTSLRGNFGGLAIDLYTRAMLLRGRHHNLIVSRYPVNQPEDITCEGKPGNRVSSVIREGREPGVLSDGYPKTFRVKNNLDDISVLRPKKKDDDRRYLHHHMLSMHHGIIFSAEGDFESFGYHVFQCNTGLLDNKPWQHPAWVKPKHCNWEQATPEYPLPNKIEGLQYPLSDLDYYHSFKTRVVPVAGHDEL